MLDDLPKQMDMLSCVQKACGGREDAQQVGGLRLGLPAVSGGLVAAWPVLVVSGYAPEGMGKSVGMWDTS